jgi:hypothetical protein
MRHDYWSREELEVYCDNPNQLISRANEMRYEMLRGFFRRLKERFFAALG